VPPQYPPTQADVVFPSRSFESSDFILFSSSSTPSLPDLVMSYAKSSAKTTRKITFFVPGGGIDREVISTDICRYLGNDATVKPGAHSVCKQGSHRYTITITNPTAHTGHRYWRRIERLFRHSISSSYHRKYTFVGRGRLSDHGR
jgi:hypothetical protein